MNKYRIFGVIGGMAIFLTVFGYWAKITHQAYADSLLKIGMWTLAISAGLYVYAKVSRFAKKK